MNPRDLCEACGTNPRTTKTDEIVVNPRLCDDCDLSYSIAILAEMTGERACDLDAAGAA